MRGKNEMKDESVVVLFVQEALSIFLIVTWNTVKISEDLLDILV